MNQLIGFIRSGTFNGVQLGDSYSDLFDRFGDPWIDRSNDRIWRYGPLEVVLRDWVVNELRLRSGQLDRPPWHRWTNFRSLRRQLRLRRIAHHLEPSPAGATHQTLVIDETGVRLTFNAGRRGHLVKASLAAHCPSSAARSNTSRVGSTSA